MNHILIENECKCCGCKSCQNICPRHAISMVENEEGFLYPIVDEKKCINCGLCKKICPMLNDISRDKYLKNAVCIAAKTKDENIQLNSSSGGIFGTFATNVLEKNGIVVGSTMDSNHNVKHIIINNIDNIYDIMGSKYVYSDLNTIFVEIKENLNNNKQVLFSGVPCQVAALLNYLQKDYTNLITIEVICHGTPSQKLFNKYVEYLEKKYNAKLIDYKFRSKEAANWGTYKSMAKFVNLKNNKIFVKKINADFDPYYWNFLNAKNYRESCYECKFANPNRNSDITLGDFWGIEHIKPEMVDYKGVSIVVINTEKGLNFFETMKDKIEYEKVEYGEIRKNNGQLQKPSKRPKERDTWYNNFESEDFIRNIKIKKNFKSYVKVFFPQKLKFKIKKIISKKK